VKKPNQIYKEAIEAWGPELQTMMLMEEVGELFQAWSKYRRGDGITQDVIGEIADVRIMLEQLEVMIAMDGGFPLDAIQQCTAHEREKKIARLAELLGSMGGDQEQEGEYFKDPTR
jgi:NTP pyrophosphatase (non-canonical NTP hydrolase)